LLALKNMKKSMNVYLQLIRPDSKNKVPSTMKSFICLEEFRSALLAQSLICPGFSTLICNLFTSRQPLNNVTEKWVTEYSYGSIHSIYKIDIPSSVQGRHYIDVVNSMYFGTTGALVVGVEEEVVDDKVKTTHIWLFPPATMELTANMSLLLIAHSVHSPSIRVDTPAIVRQSSNNDFDVPQTGVMHSIYNKLFMPLIDDVVTEQEDSMFRSLLSSSSNPGSLRASIELAPLGLTALSGTGGVTPSTSPPPSFSPPLPSSSTSASRTFSMSSLPSTGALNKLSSNQILLQRLCKAEFNGNWSELLRATLTAIDKTDSADIAVKSLTDELRCVLDRPCAPVGQEIAEDVDGKLDLRAHTLVCGRLEGLSLFLQFMRLPHMMQPGKRIQPIVVLTQDDTSILSEHTRNFPALTFVKGSFTNRHDLEKCNIRSASKVVVLSDPYCEIEGSEAADSEAIIEYLDLGTVVKNIQILIELVNETNLRFLRKGTPVMNHRWKTYAASKEDKSFHKPDYYAIPDFAAGQVFTWATLDSLICQIYYQDHLVDVAKELTFGLNGLRKVLCMHEAGAKSRTQSYCFQIPVPSEYHGHSYGDLFRDLLTMRDLLALGLYRCKEMTGAPMPYVFTCPPPSTPVHEHDKVFVLSHSPYNDQTFGCSSFFFYPPQLLEVWTKFASPERG